MPFLRAEKQFTKGSKTVIVGVCTNLEEMEKLSVVFWYFCRLPEEGYEFPMSSIIFQVINKMFFDHRIKFANLNLKS